MVSALGLLKFVPDLIGLFDKDKSVVDKVTDIAKSMTGMDTVDEAEKALAADPNLAYQFKLAVMDNETVLENLDEQSRARATDQYKTHHKQADKIAESIMRWNLITIFVLVVVNIFTVYYLKKLNPANAEIIAVVSNLIGVVIGQLLQERHSVVAFFFGSSLGSKIKTAIKK